MFHSYWFQHGYSFGFLINLLKNMDTDLTNARDSVRNRGGRILTRPPSMVSGFLPILYQSGYPPSDITTAARHSARLDSRIGGKIWTDALTDALLSGTWHPELKLWRKGGKNEPQP